MHRLAELGTERIIPHMVRTVRHLVFGMLAALVLAFLASATAYADSGHAHHRPASAERQADIRGSVGSAIDTTDRAFSPIAAGHGELPCPASSHTDDGACCGTACHALADGPLFNLAAPPTPSSLQVLARSDVRSGSPVDLLERPPRA
ncbi:hypothetical protein [Prosthecodimorpha staleyi]|uniref:Uncharacterized protein n=1 Tax=Prosthecodimorpha staleyi TaxID=2840188 RepID=A0A947GFR4_9HYPH|nr:hypothetical protein [Prosthecodimorpha staleyi]MBT9290900.1 hypothetical protein [Prosthecodimorpha staleyi]